MNTFSGFLVESNKRPLRSTNRFIIIIVALQYTEAVKHMVTYSSGGQPGWTQGASQCSTAPTGRPGFSGRGGSSAPRRDGPPSRGAAPF